MAIYQLFNNAFTGNLLQWLIINVYFVHHSQLVADLEYIPSETFGLAISHRPYVVVHDFYH